MKADGYNSDELKAFYRVLEAAIAEATEKAIDLPVHELTRRLFAAAERGERDEARLRLAMFGKSHKGSFAEKRQRAAAGNVAPVSSRPRHGRPILTLFPKHPRSTKRPAVG